VSPDVKDAPQHIELLESDFQFTGLGNPGLLSQGESREEERQAEDLTDILLDNVSSFLLRTAPGMRKAGARAVALNYWASWILNGTLSSTQCR
jgi:hypothetical protein